jgi:hypothetical protein
LVCAGFYTLQAEPAISVLFKPAGIDQPWAAIATVITFHAGFKMAFSANPFIFGSDFERSEA